MQEFSSISVSSYEAGALADQLTEQATDGWSVVAIVPTGSTVTAYLSRDASTSDTAAVAPPAAAAVASTASAASAAETATEAADETDSSGAESGEADASSHPMPTAADGGDSSGDSGVAEAPGWAAESSAGATAVAPELPTQAASAAVTQTPAAAAVDAATAATAAGGAAPAGWYADPSSRFELRYWDGGQWTEHVSRAGQQYTDPPVA